MTVTKLIVFVTVILYEFYRMCFILVIKNILIASFYGYIFRLCGLKIFMVYSFTL